MKLVFLDESGYSFNWLNDIDNQPFYVLSAVAIDAASYGAACAEIQEAVAAMNLPGVEHPLGKGSEIKARQVTNGQGWWRDHNDERNHFRDLMLDFPRRFNGTAFLVVIDKARHRNQYVTPADPVPMAMQFLFERLEWYLREINDTAYCIHDHDKRRTDTLHEHSVDLIRGGSQIEFYSAFYGRVVNNHHDLAHIIEMALGSSVNSVGLQIADFFATCAYTYFRDGQPADCGWWGMLSDNLYHENGVLDGRGLKVFPR